VTALKIGDSLHTRDLSIPNAVILTGADLTIATVVPPRPRKSPHRLRKPRPKSPAELSARSAKMKSAEGEAAPRGKAPRSGGRGEAQG